MGRVEGRPELTETDYALIDAMQGHQRAPWVEIADVVETSATTVRRRWDRIVASGKAWTCCMPGRGGGAVMTSVEVSCAPGGTASAAAELSRCPEILNIAQTTGDYDLLLVVCTPGVPELTAILDDVIGAVSGVAKFRSSIITRLFKDGSTWEFGAVRKDRKLLRQSSPQQVSGELTLHNARVRRVYGLLEEDGRASTSTIAAALNFSEPHARRYVKSLIDRDIIVQRVDSAFETSGWPYSLVLHLEVSSTYLAEAVSGICSYQGTRLCAALAGGPSNLLVIAWLRTLEQSLEVEAQIAPSSRSRVIDRSLIARYYKRSGFTFNAHQERDGFISWLGD